MIDTVISVNPKEGSSIEADNRVYELYDTYKEKNGNQISS